MTVVDVDQLNRDPEPVTGTPNTSGESPFIGSCTLSLQRAERQGRGTHGGGDAGEIKSLGHPRFSIGRRQSQFSYQRVVAGVGMDKVKDRFILYQHHPR
jgi:hypothetical protein